MKVQQKMNNMEKNKSKLNKLTVRQYFYSKEVLDKENIIISLERKYKQEKKSNKDWIKILSDKGIVLK